MRQNVCYIVAQWLLTFVKMTVVNIMYIYFSMVFTLNLEMGQALGTQLYTFYKSSFSVIHQVGKIGSFALFNIENKLYRGINHFNFNLKHHDKCQFVLKLIWLLIVCNLFPLEVVQKLQCCQLLCILGKLDCNLLISLQLIYT